MKIDQIDVYVVKIQPDIPAQPLGVRTLAGD